MALAKILRSLLFLTLISIGCDSTSLHQTQLRIFLPTEPPTLDPNQATDNVSFQLLNQLQEGLTQFDESLNVLPANAARWDVSADGLVYRFFLDPKYHWSDGTPVKAKDFADSWLRLLDPKTASQYAYFLYPIKGAREFNEGKTTDSQSVKIEAVNEKELKVTLNEPTVYFPMITTFMVTYPIRSDLLKAHPKFYSDPKIFVSNGSYTLQRWDHDNKLVLTRNSFYGGTPTPQIEEIKIYIVPEPITALALYLHGDLDYVSLPPLAIQKYKSRPDHVSIAKLRGYYYSFNQKKSPFDQAKWRQALAMALDKSQIPKILMGEEVPTNSWIPKGMFGYDEKIGLNFDPQKARELIAADLPKMKDQTLELHFNSDLVNKRIAEWAQEEWRKNLGIKVELVNEEWKSYLNQLDQNPPQIFRLGWGADFPDPDNFMNLFTSFSGNNHTGWKNSEYDELIKRAAGLSDPVQRKKVYDEAQRLLLEKETVIVPLFITTAHYLVSPRVQPLPLNPLDFVYFKKVKLH